MVKFVPAADVHQFGQLVHAVTGQSAAQAGKRARTEAAKSRIPKRKRHAGDAAPGDAANPAREPVDAPAQSGCQRIPSIAFANLVPAIPRTADGQHGRATDREVSGTAVYMPEGG